MDEEAALAKLNNSGVDAVVTIVLLDKEKEKKVCSGPYQLLALRLLLQSFLGLLWHDEPADLRTGLLCHRYQIFLGK